MEGGALQVQQKWEGYVDWKNRPALQGRHGGMLAAFFVLVVEILENLAFLANASNLVLYLEKHMHFSLSKSANSVTNFMGTAFLLALLGGFLSDAFCTTYVIFLLSAVVEFLGLVALTAQAHFPSLRPLECATSDAAGQELHGGKAAILFLGLYLVALGVGGIKGSLPSHGAEQFDESTLKGRKQRSTFFNYFVFCLSFGGLIAVTFVVWIEDNKGWRWGFGISTLAILIAIPVFLGGSRTYRNKTPSGSPLTTIFKVLSAAVLSSCSSGSQSTAIVNMTPNPACLHQDNREDTEEREITQSDINNEAEEEGSSKQQAGLTKSLNYLNRAVQNKPVHPMLECSEQQVEDVKIVLKILPIFGCTIMLNCCLAQLSTFSVQQAATMDTKLGSLQVPPASLPVFPILFIMFLAPVYNHVILPMAQKIAKTEMGITHLQRIGIGLILSIIAMTSAALVEVKRKKVASGIRLLNPREPLPISFLWIALQYLFLGSADLFTLAGLLEFFFTEAPTRMRSLATSLSWASLAVGYYLSSVIVSIVNGVTGSWGSKPWLSGGSLNHYHLDRFYWLMCVLSVVNFLHYLVWAIRYKYSSVGASYRASK